MRLIKHNPELTAFNHLFDSFFRDEPMHWMQKTSPRKSKLAVNIHETDEAYNLEVLVPGFSKEELHIELEKGILNLKAEHQEEQGTSEKNYTRREFRKQSFERSFRLPENEVDEDNISANFKNGILELSIPKLKKVENESKILIEIH